MATTSGLHAQTHDVGTETEHKLVNRLHGSKSPYVRFICPGFLLENNWFPGLTKVK